MSEEGLLYGIKRFVVGKPIPSHLAHHERLSRKVGLAVLSSDALSSVAYATEEILRVLILAGAAALSIASPIALVIAAILAVVVFSYRQTIYAYPSGGGAYIVASENLGELPALIAAGALLIDYILTVAVSIAAGVAALTSAFPSGSPTASSRARVRGRADARQPARHPRIGADLRRSDLLLHRHHPRVDCRSARGTSLAGSVRPVTTEAPCRWRLSR